MLSTNNKVDLINGTDEEVDEAFMRAVEAAVNNSLRNGLPVSKYEAETGRVYLLHPDGAKQYV